jgi:hypothetical protein
MQQLRLAPDRVGADIGTGRQGGERVRWVGGRATRAEDDGVACIFPPQGAGKHDAGG